MEPKELTGKTIRSASTSGFSLELQFTDGTAAKYYHNGHLDKVALDVEVPVDAPGLIASLNAHEEFDELYGRDFELDSVEYSKTTKVHFSLHDRSHSYGHYIEFKKDGSFKVKLDDPYEGCGADEEITEVIQEFLNKK